MAAAVQGGQHAFLSDSDLALQPDQITLAPLSMDLEDRSRLWSMFHHTPYALSFALQATTVLIDGTETPGGPLPVVHPKVYVFTFREPVVSAVGMLVDNEVSPPSYSYPFQGDSHLVVAGAGFRKDETNVHLGAWEGAATVTGSTRLSIPLVPATAQAADGVLAGTQALQIEVTGPKTESGRALSAGRSLGTAITIHPRVDTVTAGPGSPRTVTVRVVPAVAPNQTVSVMLNQLSGPGRATLQANDRPGMSSQLTVPIPDDLPSGDWLVRVVVDGAASPLTLDAAGHFDGPSITLAEASP